jgi:hypothetical protein
VKLTLVHNFVARDQYGNVYWLKKHPRKELCEHLGSSHADKMYLDDVEGQVHHVGYIIAGHWLDVMRCQPLEA